MSLLIGAIALGLRQKSFQDEQKLSPFECGFLTKGIRRGLFSVHFFLVALVFVIFDVELILLFPLLVSLVNIINLKNSVITLSVILVLIRGLL